MNRPPRSRLRAEHDEVQRDEEPSATPRIWSRAVSGRRSARPSRPRRSPRSGCSCRPSRRSTRARTARAATGAGRAPSGAAWRAGAHGAPSRARPSARAAAEQRADSGRHEHAAEHAWPGRAGLQDDRHRQDRDQVGDRDLRHHASSPRGRRAPSLGGQAAARPRSRRRAARRTRRRGRRPRCSPRAPPRGRRAAHDRRQQRAACAAIARAAVAQRQVHSDGQHQHREADFQRNAIVAFAGFTAPSTPGRRGSRRGSRRSTTGTNRRPSDAQQRPAEAGEHDHDQGPEVHGRRSLRISPTVDMWVSPLPR